MKQIIRDFPKQLKFEPIIENVKNLKSAKKFIISGMGGSHLAGDLAKIFKPSLDLIVYHDYGLPVVPGNLKNYLTIISSYSGNTEEALDGFKTAIFQKIPVAVVSTGGKLLKLAQKHKKPYIKIPDTGIEPRSALGFSAISLFTLMGQKKILSEIKKTANIFNMPKLEKKGKILAEKLKNYIPIIYTSTKNESIAYNWKIRFNETGKIPSFYGTIPEVNHNEMVGFDREGESKKLSDNFYFIFLKDKRDHKRNLLRMNILENIYKQKGLNVKVIELTGRNAAEKIFSSLLLADWASLYTAESYKLEGQETEIINRFKKIMNGKDGLV